MISLAGGMPNLSTFPLKSAKFKLTDGTSLDLPNLSSALQYSQTAGMPHLTNHLFQMQREFHGGEANADGKDWDILVTNGSQSALSKAFEAILDEKDTLLCENPTYSGALASLEPIGCNLEGCEVDEFGLIPEGLERKLQDLKTKGQTNGIVKALYTIPTGCNPSGSTLSVERKRRIYDLACEYDFLILEDDPYNFLNFGEEEIGTNTSFLKMDRENRVIRFDSFSKIISAGLRVGWATGNKELIHFLNLHQQATELHASGLSQLVTAALFDQWGLDGFRKHVAYVKDFYRKRRDFTVQCIDKYLSEDVEYFLPTAGMFVWMKLKHVKDSKSLIETKARQAKVLLVPGQAFHPNGEPGPYVRAAFSVASEEEIETGIQRLATILKEERKTKVVLCA